MFALVVRVRASAEPDDSVYDTEAIGPLRARMTEAELVKLLGKPRAKQDAIQEGATGQWVSSWEWKDSAALMVSDSGKPPWTARDVSTSHAGWATKKKIKIGSTRREVEKAYPRAPDAPPQQQQPDEYLVGSPYGGMLVTFTKDRVSSIAIGVFAF